MGTVGMIQDPLIDRATQTLRKHEIVSRGIMWAIRCGKLASGERLPNEFELAQQYSVSRNSVRRGLMRLQDKGLVERHQASGSYVLASGNSWLAGRREATLAGRYVAQPTESMEQPAHL